MTTWPEIVAGALIVVLVFWDVFETVILPRPSVRRLGLVRRVLRLLWYLWRWAGTRSQQQSRREGVLATFGPSAVLIMFGTWALLLILAYGLIFDGIRGEFHPVPRDFGTSIYFSATTLVPLSYGDFVPEGVPDRIVTVAESASGVLIAALAITLLFSLYESFQRREEMVVQLDAIAGAPPNGMQILETCAERGMQGQLIKTFEDWRGWAAAVLESHLAYPVLFWFRSSHDNEAWLNSFGAVMDAAVLTMSTVETDADGPAQLMYTVGNHLIEDLSWLYNYKRRDDPIVERYEFEAARERLRKAGYRCRGTEDAWKMFAHKRSTYAAQLNDFARLLAIVPAEWIGDRSYLPHRNRPSRTLR
jgi:hypothetical protein